MTDDCVYCGNPLKEYEEGWCMNCDMELWGRTFPFSIFYDFIDLRFKLMHKKYGECEHCGTERVIFTWMSKHNMCKIYNCKKCLEEDKMMFIETIEIIERERTFVQT